MSEDNEDNDNVRRLVVPAARGEGDPTGSDFPSVDDYGELQEAYYRLERRIRDLPRELESRLLGTGGDYDLGVRATISMIERLFPMKNEDH